MSCHKAARQLPKKLRDVFIVRELKDFIDDVTGVGADLPPPEHRGVGVIAGAVARRF